MKVKPLADRVMVKLEKNEAKTAGGIIFPIQPRKKPSREWLLKTETTRTRSRYRQARKSCMTNMPEPRSKLTE